MVKALKRVKKALGALLGAATGVGVTKAAEALFGATLDPALADSVAVIFAYAGAYLAPKNEVKAETEDALG